MPVVPMDQYEIQLGHLCNGRCVFCVSGRLTARNEAPLLDAGILVERLRDAAVRGYRRVTLLGGEPTLQPAFLDVVRAAVALGFEEIVIFTNGSKLGRGGLIDRVLATGGRFEWRLSVQGGTRDAHDGTTGRKGSFDDVVGALDALHARGQRVTVNTCVVTTNVDALAALPAVLVPRGVAQVHVDMLNPYDTGTMSDDDVRAIQPRYAATAAPLAAMIAAFPASFDVTIGSLPPCVVPRLAPWIHHGGQPTWTVTANDFGDRALQRGRIKYLLKASGRRKSARCRSCLLDERCDGVFEAYTRWHGDAEFVPVTTERLATIDADGELVALHARPLLREALREEELHAPFVRARVDEHDLRSVSIELSAGASGPRLGLALRRGRGGVAGTELFRIEVVSRDGPPRLLLAALERFVAALARHGARVLHPPGADALEPLAPAVAAKLARLRAHAPFGSLEWRTTRVADDRRRVEIEFFAREGGRATLWLAERGGGYRLGGAADEETPALVDGLSRVMAALGVLRGP